MKKLFLVAALSIGALGLAGCSEKAQEETREAADAVGDDVTGAAAAASTAAAEAGNKVEGAAEATKTEAGQAIEAAGEAANKTGEKMQN